jgi:hypothetical protein
MTVMYGGTQKAASSWLYAVLRDSTMKVARPKEWHYWSKVLGFNPQVKRLSGELGRPLTFEEFLDESRRTLPLSGVRLDELAPLNGFAPRGRWTRFSRYYTRMQTRPTSALDHWVRLMTAYDVGDFTPANVVLTREHWGEIIEAIPDLRVIVGIRNPSQRVWSTLRRRFAGGLLDGSVSPEQVIDFVSLPGQFQRSFVSQTIRSLQSVGAKIFVYSLDEVADDETLLERVGDFVGAHLNPHPPENVGPPSAIPPAIAEVLGTHFRREQEFLEELAGRSLVA